MKKMNFTNEQLQKIKEERVFRSDTDSLLICQLIERIQAYEEYFKENGIEEMEKKLGPYYEAMAKFYNEEE